MSDVKTIKFSEVLNFSPKQKLATETADKYMYTLYGGAAGGGKSYWLRWYCVRWLIKKWRETGLKGITAALFCEDYPALKDRQLSKIAFEFPDWLGKHHADHKDFGNCFILNPEWGSGVVAFRNLDDTSKYKSAEFALIAVDELTKNEEETFNLLRFRKRWKGIADTKFIAGTNPGEIGHAWVRRLWIDKEYTPEEQKIAHEFAYIQATVDDNPYVEEAYIRDLDSLPEKMRKAYREGDWDIFEGQFFTEFSRARHVIEPFAIPVSWKLARSIDVSGKNGITSCHWFAVDWDGKVWVYREYYATGKEADEHARAIRDLSEGEIYAYTVIDNSAFNKLGLPETIAEVYQRNGVQDLVPSSKDRRAGWDSMHRYLRWDEENSPSLMFFSNCTNAIRTIPTLIHDDKHIDDVDTDGEDHAADEIRYFLQTLREKASSKPLTRVEQLMKQLKEKEENNNYQYTR